MSFASYEALHFDELDGPRHKLAMCSAQLVLRKIPLLELPSSQIKPVLTVVMIYPGFYALFIDHSQFLPPLMMIDLVITFPGQNER